MACEDDHRGGLLSETHRVTTRLGGVGTTTCRRWNGRRRLEASKAILRLLKHPCEVGTAAEPEAGPSLSASHVLPPQLPAPTAPPVPAPQVDLAQVEAGSSSAIPIASIDGQVADLASGTTTGAAAAAAAAAAAHLAFLMICSQPLQQPRITPLLSTVPAPSLIPQLNVFGPGYLSPHLGTYGPAQLAPVPLPPPPPLLPPQLNAAEHASCVGAWCSLLRADAPLFSPGVIPPTKVEDPLLAGFSPLTPSFDLASCVPWQTEVCAAGNLVMETLPAVVAVKKNARGCAVVLLRDRVLLETCIRQGVAVIDGVCVEVRRHFNVKPLEDGEELPMGLFIAWGNRVERKATISEEALETYFNALPGVAHVPCPQAQPPFGEGLLRFPVCSKAARRRRSLLPLDMSPSVETPSLEHMLNGTFCDRKVVENVWEAKLRLDERWTVKPPPLARGLLLRVARTQLFPHSDGLKAEFSNRAGAKLEELATAVGLLDGVPRGSAFLDLCGGPGAWSLFLLEKKELALSGFGFTLRTGAGSAEDWQAEDKDQWYPDLQRREDWCAIWGADDSGDLLKPCNIDHCVKKLPSDGVFLCLADGGFSGTEIPQNELELYFYRLLLAEFHMAARCLKPGGRFVCKMYTTFSAATASLLYIATRLFESVELVKPQSSRATGPEKYLSAFGFRPRQETKDIRAALARAHAVGNGDSPLTTPLLTPIVSADNLSRDSVFTEALRQASLVLAERQTQALRAVVERAALLEEVAMKVSTAAVPSSILRRLHSDSDSEKTKTPPSVDHEVTTAAVPSSILRRLHSDSDSEKTKTPPSVDQEASTLSIPPKLRIARKAKTHQGDGASVEKEKESANRAAASGRRRRAHRCRRESA
eukprot:TRINITY_DN4066_c0_g1_i1.p1 TRINITY_DN4066_c0_g1~~TRINITY_DN4066_c0_g1_i1.p1  ORF type:complete len:873 (-),score=136.88 TRINITY_DN4066_c0_g1_i1:203-2821(-)